MYTLITQIEPKDIPKVAEIYEKFCKKDFTLPSPYTSLGEAVVRNSTGEIIAYGVLEVFVEALLVLNRERSLREKAEAVSKLIHSAKNKAKNINVSSIYVFSRDPQWTKLLKEHFGFVTCEGETLVLRV